MKERQLHLLAHCKSGGKGYLWGFEVPSPPVGVYSVLPDVGTFPRAVGEAGFDNFPLLEGQRLIDACDERDGADVNRGLFVLNKQLILNNRVLPTAAFSLSAFAAES